MVAYFSAVDASYSKALSHLVYENPACLSLGIRSLASSFFHLRPRPHVLHDFCPSRSPAAERVLGNTMWIG